MSQTIRFETETGDRLAGVLEVADGDAVGHAIFAHCFTCSKDLHVVRRVSAALNRRGIGVLRFDFTGLGESEGEFAESHFGRNVADLLAAAGAMREADRPVGLLIGHSLGGAAVLAAAGQLERVAAVATIGAPSEPAHVKRLLATPEFDENGKATVTIAGRSFTITREFFEALDEANLRDHIAALRRPLMIFHSPRDEVVGIDNAEKIFKAARHPKSFVSLGDADHLVRRAEDAEFLGDVIGAWASYYMQRSERN